MGGSSHWAAGRENFIFFHCLLDGAQFRYTLHAYMFLPWLAWNVLNTWPPHRTSSCVSTTPVWRNAWGLLTHSKAPHKDKSDWYFIPAGEAFSPACFVMPFFSCANFAELFSFQLLTFVATMPTGGKSTPARRAFLVLTPKLQWKRNWPDETFNGLTMSGC